MKNLGNDLLDGLGSFHTNQAFVQTTMKESEVIGVQSKLVQDGSVQATHMELIINSPASNSSVEPTDTPPLIPPPAIHMVKPYEL